MRTNAVLSAALATVIGYGIANAIPWPGDDAGLASLDKTISKCEIKASKNVSKLVAAILKCQTKLVDNAFKAKPPLDEQACEATAEGTFTAKTLTADCPCVDVPGIIGIAEPVINSNANLTLCDPAGPLIASLPDNGAVQITGNVPSTKDILKYENKVGKNISKLVATYLKCHQAAQANYQKTLTFDEPTEESCEAAAVSAFNTAVAGLTGGQGCEDIAGVVSLTEAQLEGGNFLTFCAD